MKNLQSKEAKIVIYDGHCKMCSWWANFVIKHDKNHRLVLYGRDDEMARCLNVNDTESILFYDGINVYEKSSAIIKVLTNLSYPIKLFVIIRLIPRVFRDKIYDFIAKNRYVWGKKSCRIKY